MDKYQESKMALERAILEMSNEANEVYEAMRVDALKKTNILDTIGESDYDDLVRLAACVTGASTALITFLDQSRMWIKANYGCQLPANSKRSDSFCSEAIKHPEDALVVPDALLDDRFKQNYWVTDQQLIRFYAGIPIMSDDDLPIGALCVIDNVPRQITEQQMKDFKIVARIVNSLIANRK
jgi:two-component system, NtrC family, sensor kinase